VAKGQFTGAWKLVSSEFRRSDGQVIYPLGSDAAGMLIYDSSGHMSAQLMRRDRPNFASDDRLLATPSETEAAFKGFTSEFGTYEVNEEEATVTHHIEGHLFPNLVGSDQIRFFTLSGNRLTLSTPPLLMGGQQMTGVLVWERVG